MSLSPLVENHWFQGLTALRTCRPLAVCALVVVACGGPPESPPPTPAPGTSAPASEAIVDLVVDSTAAEAVLSILAQVRAEGSASPEAWSRLFESDGYNRLGERKKAMNRPFDQDSFRAFVLSPELAAREAVLAETLSRWKEVTFEDLASRIQAYLPAGAPLRATIFPMIKPRGNSFVFDLTGDPAIFLFLDPTVTPESFTNTVLHELHHIGFGASCPPEAAATAVEALAEGPRRALRWLGAFGEGFAMLAAAGDAKTHPHAVSPEAERLRWDEDVARFAEDRQAVETFFLDLLAGRLNEDQGLETARSFYGVQGPWYTVGWKMAVTIEESLGREVLIQSFCDSRLLLPNYNRAARAAGVTDPGELWSEELVTALAGSRPSAG